MEKLKLEGTFKDLTVEVPDIEEYKKELGVVKKELVEAKTADEAIVAVRRYFEISDTYMTYSAVIYVHFTQDTNNQEYLDAQDKIDEVSPLFTELFNDFEEVILGSKYLADIEQEFGSKLITLMKLAKEVFSSAIIEDLQVENKLVSEYSKLKSSVEIEFEGKTYNLSEMSLFFEAKDRERRKKANEAYWLFYESHDKEFGDLYDKLVKVRTKIAHKLGFNSFTELGYKRMQRVDYGPKDTKVLRDEILKSIVPTCSKYHKEQMEGLGIDDPKYYDYMLFFKDGNPVPNGNTLELTLKAESMYGEMNEEVAKYFTFMKEHELFDLEARKGKQGGGYQIPLDDLKVPFVFANFNGSQGDVGVLTHEFGHALQCFLSANIENPYDRSPGLETCEIHSMSMELLAYPYLGYLFDDKNLTKYRYGHLVDSLLSIPYLALVDDFQHVVYDNVDMTPAERKKAWRDLEKAYMPHLVYGEENSFLEEGGYWYRQGHIFESPFYYIDYAIAQLCAFEFFIESQEDYDRTITKYLDFCRLGGKYFYKELLAKASIANPMEKGVIGNITKEIDSLIAKYEQEYKE